MLLQRISFNITLLAQLIVTCLCFSSICCESEHVSFDVSENDITYQGDDYSYLPYQTFPNTPQYLVVAPSEVRPGQTYRIIVTLLSSKQPLNFMASLQRDGEEIASAHDLVSVGDTKALLMKIPVESRQGQYHLQVEGNVNGVLGGTGFINKAMVNFSQRFLSILIQTNQLVYNIRQSIRIRVILLDMEMKPYIDPVDVFLLDSRGYVMKRWLSVYPFQGFVSLVFALPGDYPLGWWKVRVVCLGQIEEKAILLERWFTDRFDVSVTLPAFVSTDDRYIEGMVAANHTNYMPVAGNATVKVYLKPKSLLGPQQLVTFQNIRRFSGSFEFKYDLVKLLGAMPVAGYVGSEIEVQVTVSDRFYEHSVIGYARTRVINSTVVLTFLDTSPTVFKPGMPFETHLSVSYDGHVPLPSDRLAGAVVTLTPSSNLIKTDEEGLRVTFDENGVAKLRFIVPKNLDKFSITADYVDGVASARAQLSATRAFSARSRYLHITSSTSIGEAGNYGIFQVRANFYVKFFYYIIVSKGGVITHGKEKALGMVNSVTSFSVSLSPEMAPSCKVIAYHVTPDGEIIADMLILPIKGISREELVLDINRKQDRSGNLVELIPKLAIGSIIGTSAHDVDNKDVQGFNEITPASALIELYRHVRGKHKKFIWRNSAGRNEKVEYYVTPNVARDTEATFAFSDLLVFTNLNIISSPNYCLNNQPLLGNTSSLVTNSVLDSPVHQHGGHDDVPVRELLIPCLTNAICYPVSKRCDGRRDCPDGSDESDCNESESTSGEVMQFLLYRRNRNNWFYQATGSDFSWEDTFTGYSEDNYIPVIVPERPVTWSLNAIGVSQGKGLSILQATVPYNSARPFFITVEAPTDIVIGEQIGIKVAVFNYQEFEIRADVVLMSCIDYRFVQVEPKGRVSHYQPRTTTGNQQHLIYIRPYSSKLVHMPVVATTKGKIRVTIVGRSQVGKYTKEIEMNVMADGVSVDMHTSLLLDMTSQAYLVKFLNINVTEDPVIPFVDHIQRFVSGSPEATVSLIGDVVGAPGFLEDKLVDFSSMGISRPAKSGELMMFNFAYHFYTVLYLRLTDQLRGEDRLEQTKQWLDILNQDYVSQVTFFRNGSFSMFKRSPGSVWLSAYCAKVYHEAIYAEWEHLLYIDSEIIRKAVHFVLHHQQADGSFIESQHMPRNMSTNTHRFTPVALTSHVLITLCKVTTGLGKVGIEVANAKKSAVQYLEHMLPNIMSPYEIAITTFALYEARSVESKVGFDLLERHKRTVEGMVYWSSQPMEAPRVIYQSQRPFIQHRSPSLTDAEAVEGTAYALMVYIRFGGLIQDQIVKWLNFMRLHSDGFISTYDTIVAMEALIDFSFRTHVRSITNMNFLLEPSSQPEKFMNADLNSDNLAHQVTLPIVPKVWGHVTISAKGSGYSIVQLHTKYNVNKKPQLLQPPVKAFELNVHVSASGRNKSMVHFRSCGRWLLSHEQPISGIAMMEIDLPTGYLQYKPVIDQLVDSGSVPRLRRARVLPKSAVFMFDYLTHDWSCVHFTVERWFPVANATRWTKAKLSDISRPELFTEEILDNYALYVLNVCEVCGSYQCPYCPFFSGSTNISLSTLLVILVVIMSCKQIHLHTSSSLIGFT